MGKDVEAVIDFSDKPETETSKRKREPDEVAEAEETEIKEGVSSDKQRRSKRSSRKRGGEEVAEAKETGDKDGDKANSSDKERRSKELSRKRDNPNLS